MAGQAAFDALLTQWKSNTARTPKFPVKLEQDGNAPSSHAPARLTWNPCVEELQGEAQTAAPQGSSWKTLLQKTARPLMKQLALEDAELPKQLALMDEPTSSEPLDNVLQDPEPELQQPSHAEGDDVLQPPPVPEKEKQLEIGDVPAHPVNAEGKDVLQPPPVPEKEKQLEIGDVPAQPVKKRKTFASRYPPTKSHLAERFQAIRDAFDSIIKPKINSPSSSEDMLFLLVHESLSRPSGPPASQKKPSRCSCGRMLSTSTATRNGTRTKGQMRRVSSFSSALLGNMLRNG